jgi:hypothetical protein
MCRVRIYHLLDHSFISHVRQVNRCTGSAPAQVSIIQHSEGKVSILYSVVPFPLSSVVYCKYRKKG